MSRHIECANHGVQPSAVMCTHLVTTIDSGEVLGVVWSVDEEGRLNGYCPICDAQIQAGGGASFDDVTELPETATICEACFKKVLNINGVMEIDR